MSKIAVEAACSDDFKAIQELFRLMFDIFFENQAQMNFYTGIGFKISGINYTMKIKAVPSMHFSEQG